MSKKTLSFRQVQLGSMEVLKKLIELCDAHEWKYCLAYGSMLGAVRHKGVIPWDDDIDIIMPRPDYEKLRAYFVENEEALYPFKLFDKANVPDYPHMIARVSDQRYHLVFENEKDYDIGLFVDIYPMDGMGNDYDAAVKMTDKTKWIASLCFLTGRKSFGVDNTYSILKMILKLPAYCWAKLWGNQHYINKLAKAASVYDYHSSEYVACVVWPTGKSGGQQRDVFRREIFEDLIEVPFEDITAKIPRQYDEFLTISYGDYMQPPPEDKRTTNHTYIAVER